MKLSVLHACFLALGITEVVPLNDQDFVLINAEILFLQCYHQKCQTRY